MWYGSPNVCPPQGSSTVVKRTDSESVQLQEVNATWHDFGTWTSFCDWSELTNCAKWVETWYAWKSGLIRKRQNKCTMVFSFWGDFCEFYAHIPKVFFFCCCTNQLKKLYEYIFIISDTPHGQHFLFHLIISNQEPNTSITPVSDYTNTLISGKAFFFKNIIYNLTFKAKLCINWVCLSCVLCVYELTQNRKTP